MLAREHAVHPMVAGLAVLANASVMSGSSKKWTHNIKVIRSSNEACKVLAHQPDQPIFELVLKPGELRTPCFFVALTHLVAHFGTILASTSTSMPFPGLLYFLPALYEIRDACCGSQGLCAHLRGLHEFVCVERLPSCMGIGI